MLHYSQQYDISNGVFITFDQQLKQRMFKSNHKQATRDKLKTFFPHNKFDTMTKENFVMTCIYIMFTKTPSSYRGLVTELYEVTTEEVQDFKYRILNYDSYIGKDIRHMNETYGASITYQQVFREFLDGNYQFYSVWFFIMFNPKINRDEIRKSRALSHVLRKLEFIMLFLTFKQESVQRIKILFDGLEF